MNETHGTVMPGSEVGSTLLVSLTGNPKAWPAHRQPLPTRPETRQALRAGLGWAQLDRVERLPEARPQAVG